VRSGLDLHLRLARDERSLFLIVWRNQADVWQLTLR
jgi:hypothetical protein